MILFNIALVVFACLASTLAGNEPDLAELKKAVLDNIAASRKLADSYLEQEYYTMEYIVYFHSLKETNPISVNRFPTNLPLANLSADEKDVYNAMRLNKFMYPYFTDASHLSDILKADALNVVANRLERNLTGEPTSSEIIDKVLQVIHQEKGILVNGRFIESDDELESLYSEIRDITSLTPVGIPELTPYFVSNWLWTMQKAFFLRNHCTMQNSLCSDLEIYKAVENFLAVDEQMRSVSPIDSKLKIDKLLNILLEYSKAWNELYKILSANELYCLVLIEGCEK